MSRVVIVGGGISGLSVAYYLAKRGIRPTLVEASGRFGGLVHTEEVHGCLLEAGPDSFISTKPWAADLARDLGIGDEVIGSNDRKRRIHIVRDRKLVPLPSGFAMMVPGELRAALRTPLFSWPTKASFLREWFIQPRSRQEDVSVAQFVREHFAEEVLDYLAEPLLTGVYGGNAETLSTESVLPRFLGFERKYGSLIRGLRADHSEKREGSLFSSFRHGMQTIVYGLISACAANVNAVQGQVTTVERSASGFRVRVNDDWMNADEVILACQAHHAAGILRKELPEAANELDEIPYSSALLITLAFPRSAVPVARHGFGFLVPKRERKSIAACTWVHNKFAGRAAPELAVLRCFIVGEEAEQLLYDEDSRLIELVLAELRDLMNISSKPEFHLIHKWPRSMPQYSVGHAKRVERIRDELARLPGVHLIGNAYEGVGIPDCVRLAKQTAEKIGA